MQIRQRQTHPSRSDGPGFRGRDGTRHTRGAVSRRAERLFIVRMNLPATRSSQNEPFGSDATDDPIPLPRLGSMHHGVEPIGRQRRRLWPSDWIARATRTRDALTCRVNSGSCVRRSS